MTDAKRNFDNRIVTAKVTGTEMRALMAANKDSQISLMHVEDSSASLNTLPPELKALIVEFVEEMDHESDENDFQDSSSDSQDSNDSPSDDDNAESEEESDSDDDPDAPRKVARVPDPPKLAERLAWLKQKHEKRLTNIGFELERENHVPGQQMGDSQYMQEFEDRSESANQRYKEMVREVRSDFKHQMDNYTSSALSSLSRCSREFSCLAFPFLWRHVDFESQNNLSVAWFIENILSRHAQHITSIWLRTSIAENQVYDDDDQLSDFDEVDEGAIAAAPFADLFADVSPHEPVSDDEIDDSRPVPNISISTPFQMPAWSEKERRRLFATIIPRLPALVSIDFDLLKVQRSVARTTIIARAILDSPAGLRKNLKSIALTSPETNWLSATWLATFLDEFENLVSISLDGVDAGDADRSLICCLAKKELEVLHLGNCQFVGEEILGPVDTSANAVTRTTMVPWASSSSLRALALQECDRLSLPVFLLFINSFTGLRQLDLDDCPSADNEQDNLALLLPARPIDLPQLRELIITSYHHSPFFRAFDRCPLELIELGFSPNFSYAELEETVSIHSTTLKRLMIGSDSALTAAQHESLEVFCFAKGIEVDIEEQSESGDDESEESDPGLGGESDEFDDDEDQGQWQDYDEPEEDSE